MKKYIILLLAVTTIFAKKDAEIVIPDNISISDDKKEVIGTYEVDLKSDEIYSKTLLWLALNINDSRASIEYKDKESSKIVGSLNFDPQINWVGHCKVNYLIEAKDGRYRIHFTGFELFSMKNLNLREGFFTQKGYEKSYKKRWWPSLFYKTKLLFDNFHNYLNTQTKKTDDDW